MNVYIVEVARRLAEAGVEVEIFTRATASELPPTVEMAPGVTVRHVISGPFEGCQGGPAGPAVRLHPRRAARRGRRPPGCYDVIHSHYWLSGQVGWLAKERWGVPLVHNAHTLAKVKNSLLARRRPARAAGPHRRRGAGHRRGRPAGREHADRGGRADRAVRGRPAPGRGGGARRRPRPLPPLGARARTAGKAGRPGGISACRPPGRSWPSSGASSRSRPRTSCCGPSPSCADAIPSWPPA
jgi:hypothetical protein